MEKSIKGTPYLDKGNFEITPKGGNLVISKDSTSKELAFNIESEGDFKIRDGRVILEIDDGKFYTSSDTSMAISHNINLNNEYSVEEFLVKTGNGGVVFDARTEWERAIDNNLALSSKQKAQIKTALQQKLNVRPREFLGFMNSVEERDIVQWVYEACDVANQNKYGIQITPAELYTTLMLEGAGKPNTGHIDYFYYNDHYADVDGFIDLGLDFIGDDRELQRLKNGGFIPEDFSPIAEKKVNELGQTVTSGNFDSLKEGLVGLGGMVAHRKYLVTKDLGDSLSDDELFFAASYYYNSGEGAGKRALSNGGINSVYTPLSGGESDTVRNSKQNALIRTVTYQYLKRTGVFSLN